MTFSLGGLTGATVFLFRPQRASSLRQPPEVWALGVSGLFGYHALYFMALRLAPAAEASLINYLWPLLIVLLSATLPGAGLRLHHVVGAGLGMIGTAILLTGGRDLSFDVAYLPGYAAALVAALTWAIYSVLSARLAAVPTDAVAGFCLATAVCALIAHVALEQTVWPVSATQWLAVIALGLGPVGAAFYAWDFGVKHGDIRVLGAASYAAPIVSTVLLVAAGYAQASLSLALAATLIAVGGLLAARDLLRPQQVAPLRDAASPAARPPIRLD
jgi:drug/metabolite transporter (DMT)-like permease